jgi:hypothetical protein
LTTKGNKYVFGENKYGTNIAIEYSKDFLRTDAWVALLVFSIHPNHQDDKNYTISNTREALLSSSASLRLSKKKSQYEIGCLHVGGWFQFKLLFSKHVGAVNFFNYHNYNIKQEL